MQKAELKIRSLVGEIDAFNLDKVVRERIDSRYRFNEFPHYNEAYANDSYHYATAYADPKEADQEAYAEFMLWKEHKDNSHYPRNGLDPSVILTELYKLGVLMFPGNYIISLSW